MWRIKDAEELIRSRVSEVKLNESIEAIKLTLMKRLDEGVQNNVTFIENEIKLITQRVGRDNESHITSFSDVRNLVTKQDKKINELASREMIKSLENADR